MTTYAERFRSKYVPGDGCWLCAGAESRGGYVFFKANGRQRYAHRVAWELAHGPVPAGLLVLHKCDAQYPAGDTTYRRCVNPDHLFLGTHQDNMDDMWAKGRGPSGDRNASRLYPERRPRGDQHRSRREPSVMPRGERNGRARLTADRVLAIRAAVAGGESRTTVARRFGVARSTVYGIVERQTWRHVGEDSSRAELERRRVAA